jgi:glutamyl-tRNA synthetase
MERGMPGLKERAKTLVELAEKAEFYVKRRPLTLDDKAAKVLTPEGRQTLALFRQVLAATPTWTLAALEAAGRDFAEGNGIGLGRIAQPLRAALTGSTVSPGIFDVIEVLGRDETLGRIDDALAGTG